MYYRVYDLQTKTYFSTGYNAESIEELIENFVSYINCSAWNDDEQETFETWEQIAEHLQGVELEISETPFEDID